VVSRRRFLQSVGAGGGAGALFATMGPLGLAPTGPATAAPFRPPRPSDFTLTGRKAATVVVLGGGVAGLAAAYELGKAGYHCTVRPYLEGAWTAPPWGRAGYDRLLKPAGRVSFAGDWLSRAVAWQHGAFVSARAAVTACTSG
jgi:monoamine oxidase